MDPYSMACEVEDILGEAGVFYNGFRGPGNRACMDSYMTCIEYTILEKKWNEIKDNYPQESWLALAAHWNSFAYLSPTCSLMASFVTRKIDKIFVDNVPAT